MEHRNNQAGWVNVRALVVIGGALLLVAIIAIQIIGRTSSEDPGNTTTTRSPSPMETEVPPQPGGPTDTEDGMGDIGGMNIN